MFVFVSLMSPCLVSSLYNFPLDKEVVLVSGCPGGKLSWEAIVGRWCYSMECSPICCRSCANQSWLPSVISSPRLYVRAEAMCLIAVCQCYLVILIFVLMSFPCVCVCVCVYPGWGCVPCCLASSTRWSYLKTGITCRAWSWSSGDCYHQRRTMTLMLPSDR